MIKVMIDTNIIIDYLADRSPFADDAERILDLCDQGDMTGVVTASAVTDVYYIMRKIAGQEKTLESLKLLFLVLEIASVGKSDLLRAMESPFPDFEDALCAMCAKRIKAECIITRNIRDFQSSHILPMTPKDFLERFFPIEV